LAASGLFSQPAETSALMPMPVPPPMQKQNLVGEY
jgi:hypothetical protein